jgi:CHAT domain-containing protein/tetratricopeptide (TPR) repeat protein
VPEAEELHRRGVDALNRGRHTAARRHLEAAAHGTEDGDLLGRIEGSLSYVLSETGEAVEALDLCRRALERPSLTRGTRAALNRQIALIQMLRGEGDDAIAAFGAAVVLTDDDLGRGIIHLNRGNVRLQRDELDAAGADFEEAERSFLAAGDTYAAAKAIHNLGYVQFRRGELVSALSRMDQARGEFTSQAGPAFVAMVEQDRAEVLLAAGLRDDSIEALRSASAAYGRRRLYQRRGEAELALARAAADQPRLARAAARRAVDLFERSNAPSWGARAAAEELAADIELRRTTNLVERGDRLVAELEGHRLHWDVLGVRLLIVGGLLDTGAVPEAGWRLRAIRMTSAAPLWLRLEHRDMRARGAQATGRRTAALEHVRTGLDELHAWQSSFGSLDLQTNVVGHGVRLAVRGLSLAVASRSDAVLFEWSERARMLASRIQPVRAPQDPQTVADLSELRAGPEPAREAELRRQIRERAWQHRGSGEVSEPVPLADLQAALDTTAALIAYVVTADRLVGLVVTDQGTRRHDLGQRARLDPLLSGLLPDLDMAAADLPPSLAGSVRGALTDRVSAVADLLVAPLLAELGDRHVVLTPSGVLAGVPWTLLPGLAGRPVTVAQSATSWLARRSTPLRTGSAGFVAGPRVARAEDEVRGAAQAWPDAPVLAGDDATAAAVSALAGRVDVLHVAAHGRHSAENPLFSGLELVDGTWFGYDIDQLDQVPDVVLLSACEVGRSSVRWGEELIGMTAAWLHAGARRVIASPAAVNDVAAHDALVRVHEALAAGIDPAAALAGTVSTVTTDAPPAPFVCFA